MEKEKPKLIQAEIALILVADLNAFLDECKKNGIPAVTFTHVSGPYVAVAFGEPQENKATPMHPPFQFQFSKHAPTIAEEKE
jgi:hypothetical protein